MLILTYLRLDQQVVILIHRQNLVQLASANLPKNDGQSTTLIQRISVRRHCEIDITKALSMECMTYHLLKISNTQSFTFRKKDSLTFVDLVGKKTDFSCHRSNAVSEVNLLLSPSLVSGGFRPRGTEGALSFLHFAEGGAGGFVSQLVKWYLWLRDARLGGKAVLNTDVLRKRHSDTLRGGIEIVGSCL